MPLISKPTLSEIRARLASRIAGDWPRAKQLTLDAWKRSAPAREWISHHPNLGIAPAIVVAILFLLIAGQVAVAATLIGAWFALARGISQAAADFRRRINETYSKAVSQLASDKLEERLGGIYTLENISKESSDDYWTVMENLTAFVRERTRRTERRIAECAYLLWEKAGRPEGRSEEFWRQSRRAGNRGSQPATDIAAVLDGDQAAQRGSPRARDQGRKKARFPRGHFERRRPPRGASRTRRPQRGASRRRRPPRGASRRRRPRGRISTAPSSGGASRRRRPRRGASRRRRPREAHLEGADLIEAHLEGADLARGASRRRRPRRGASRRRRPPRRISKAPTSARLPG